ncbi:hypothetical protein B566_EDAN011329 [Ephemera danica]|nr:hypothetical protein B566_EDAN011329 [Ephemera danica]
MAVRQRVASTIRDNLLVGYNVDKMLEVLEIGHPRQNIRDIAKYTPLINRYGDGDTPCSLKVLAFKVLGWEIQEDMKNNSIENVKSVMEIYLKFEW